MGRGWRCCCVLSRWAASLLSCSFTRRSDPLGRNFRGENLDLRSHSYTREPQSSSILGIAVHTDILNVISRYLCCWNTELVRVTQTRRSKEHSTHQRSEWQQQQRSPHAPRLHYPAPHLHSSLRHSQKQTRPRPRPRPRPPLCGQQQLLNLEKVLLRQKGREGPSQAHPGAWDFNLFSGEVPGCSAETSLQAWEKGERRWGREERKKGERGRKREIRGREADKCLWEDSVVSRRNFSLNMTGYWPLATIYDLCNCCNKSMTDNYRLLRAQTKQDLLRF